MSDPLSVALNFARRRRSRRFVLAWALGLLMLVNGCAAVSNPVADGIPVRRLPPEALGVSRELEQPIPLTYLRQPPPEVYRLAAGDVLGIWIEGVLGDRNVPPPVQMREQGNLPPAVGYPIPIRENGTIALPLIDPIKVEGLSIAEAQAEIVKAYTVTKQIIQPGRERVIVTLIQPRTYNVLVVREDAGSTSFGTTGGFGGFTGGSFFSETRRSSGTNVALPAYENDLLNALTRTGGLPGFDAENEVLIQRGGNKGGAKSQLPEPLPCYVDHPQPFLSAEQGNNQPQIIRIPLRLPPGEKPPFRPDDIILQNGDIVYVRLRRGDLFYTGGLLPPRAFPLPPGRDLDIVEAIAIVGGPLVNGGIGANNLTGNIGGAGITNISPSLITILRRTPGCGQIPIRVNLNRALRDPRERILVQAGDIIILQQTMGEAITQYIFSNLNFNFFGTLIRERDFIATGSGSFPGGVGTGVGAVGAR